MKVILCAALAASSLFCMHCAAVQAQTPYPTPWLAGQEFRLFFTTEGRTDATSPDIAYYDAFAQAEADRSPLTAGIDWIAYVDTKDGSTRFERIRWDLGELGLVLFPNGGWFMEVISGDDAHWNPFTGHYIIDIFPVVDQFGNLHPTGPGSDTRVWVGHAYNDATGSLIALGDDMPAYGLYDGPYLDYPSHSRWLGAGRAPAETELPIYAISERLVGVPVLRGDWNDDGKVDQADLDMVLLDWGELAWGFVGTRVARVSQAHLDDVLLGWGGSTTSAAIPEPSAWVLLLVVMGCVLATRLRRIARGGPAAKG